MLLKVSWIPLGYCLVGPAYLAVWSSYVTSLLIGSGPFSRVCAYAVCDILVSLYPSTFTWSVWSHLYLVKTVDGIVTELPLRSRSEGGLISQPAQGADLRSFLGDELCSIIFCFRK